jgi:hypothetical protein
MTTRNRREPITRGQPVNQYGARAQDHWRTFRPQEYASLPDPQAFFEELGQEAARQVEELTNALMRQQPTAGAYLDELAHRTTARSQADEKVLAELILLPPESTHPDADPQDREEELEQDRELEPGVTATGWAPLQEDPSDPYWQQLENPTR